MRPGRTAHVDIEPIINPNGPLLNGGRCGDNGQTGRKFVMEYQGPPGPIGGARCRETT